MAIKFTKNEKNAVITSFENAKTYESLKSEYINALKTFKTKAAREFIDAKFKSCVDAVKDKHVSMKGKAYTAEPSDTPDDFMALIATLLTLDGVHIEQCGTWLWISGDTKKYKAELKACGCVFCGQKKMWAKKPENAKNFKSKKHWSMDKIRSTYGSVEITDPEEVTA